MVYFLFAVHIYFCVKTRFVPRYTLRGIRYSLSGGEGAFSAFMQALGTTVGPGNITGVAVAISAGGAGAVFWMWLSGIIAMSTKYAESYFCLKYRTEKCGGPMVLLAREGYTSTAKLWVILCVVAGMLMGGAVPSSALADTFSCPRIISGALLTLFVIFAIFFGTKGISKICSFIVPVMSVGFIFLCLVLLFSDIGATKSAVVKIFTEAFDLRALFGGGMGLAVKSGITRGLYSNESGLGSGGVLASSVPSADPHKNALAAMTTCFWDTCVMCALTGVVFVAQGGALGCDSKALLLDTFSHSRLFLSVSMALFVYATVLGWYSVARLSLVYLSPRRRLFDFCFILSVFVGALIPARVLWGMADGVNMLMLLPSVFIFIKLSLHSDIKVLE